MIELDPISKEEAARYMGVHGEANDQIKNLLDKAEKLVRETVRPQYVYRELDLERTGDAIRLSGTRLVLTGSDIQEHLLNCNKAVIMAVTLSSDADRLIRKSSVTDMALSLAVDCMCSAAVEQVCDKAESEIFSVIEAPYRTWRFSPGYGDLPLELQSDFLEALNAHRRIGLTTTENSLLLPTKSVTAIIGVSDVPLKIKKSGCESCKMRDRCQYSKSGKSCGKQ